MDAQGRGHAGDFDPADQWVFNPNTGSYELRMNAGAGNSPSSSGEAPATPPRQRRPLDSNSTGPGPGGTGGRRRRDAAAGASVPAQREGGSERASAQHSDSGSRSSGHSRRKPKPRPSKKRKIVYWTCGVMGGLLVAGCASAYFIVDYLQGNINNIDVGIDNAARDGEPVNILVLGTDARDGKGNTGYGDTGNAGHADTTFLFHVSKDRTNATALSIPRDMITDIPECPTKQEDGSTKNIPGTEQTRFNTSLGQNGRDPGCTWRTVEKLTGIKINHFMMADFNAVKELSSAVGGVEVCTEKPINDPKSHLKLSKGKNVVEGEQALAFVRTRASVGTGSDLSRIELQQQFLSSMIRKMKSGDTLSSPSKLWKLSDAATKALTVDSNLDSTKKLVDLANDLKRVDTEHITFATVPVLDNPKDPATVILNEPKAKPLFKMVRNDASMTDIKKRKKEAEEKPKAKKAPASEVNVEVRNGGGPGGAAEDTTSWLSEKGIGNVVNGGNAPKELDETRLVYGPDQAGEAARLIHELKLPGSVLKKSSDGSGGGAGGAMTLTLGGDFAGPGKKLTAPDKSPDGVDRIKADQKVCAS